MITMKFAIFASALLCAGVLSAQKYSVTVETHIAGKPEDKFTFVIAEGGSQHKGFDGKARPAVSHAGRGGTADALP